MSHTLSNGKHVDRTAHAGICTCVKHAHSRPISTRDNRGLHAGGVTVIMPRQFVTLSLPFLHGYVNNVYAVTSRHNCSLVLYCTSGARCSRLRQRLTGRGISNIVLACTVTSSPYVRLLQRCGAPFILVKHDRSGAVPRTSGSRITTTYRVAHVLLRLNTGQVTLLINDAVCTIGASHVHNCLHKFTRFNIPMSRQLIRSNIRSTKRALSTLRTTLRRGTSYVLYNSSRVTFRIVQRLQAQRVLIPGSLQITDLCSDSVLTDVAPSISTIRCSTRRLNGATYQVLLSQLTKGRVIVQRLRNRRIVLQSSAG